MNKKELIKNAIENLKESVGNMVTETPEVSITADEKMNAILKGLVVYVKENNNLFSEAEIISGLRESVNRLEAENVKLRNHVKALNEDLIEAEKLTVIIDELNGFSDKVQSKIVELSEKMRYEDIEEFRSNLRVIKESFNVISNDDVTKKVLAESVDKKSVAKDSSFLKERRAKFDEQIDVTLKEDAKAQNGGNTAEYMKF